MKEKETFFIYSVFPNDCRLQIFSYFRSFNEPGFWIASFLAMTRGAYESEVRNLEILES